MLADFAVKGWKDLTHVQAHVGFELKLTVALASRDERQFQPA